MRKLLGIAVVAASALVLPVPAEASWVSEHCFDDHNVVKSWKRADAKAYATVAAWEGYEYAGGCWNDNDRDDTPNAPDSFGEGPDCSGLVFKAWMLRLPKGQTGGMWWNRMENVHGSYSSTMFATAEAGWPFFVLPEKDRMTTAYMDAMARKGHIGLLYVNGGTSSGTDVIVHAKGDAYGTVISEEAYRFDTDYVAVRRRGWTADCEPQCSRPLPATPLLVRVP